MAVDFSVGDKLSKYQAVNPQRPGMMFLCRLCKQNEGNLQRKRGRKKASCLLNYSFAPKKFFQIHSQHAKIYQKKHYISRSFGGVQLYI